MWTHHLRLAWRSLTKAPVYSLLNLGGLALGIAAAFVLGLYVRQELTVDAGFADGDRVYRVATDFFGMGGFANSQAQLADVLPQEVADVEWVTRVQSESSLRFVLADGSAFEETGVLRADTSFFDVFAYPFEAGSPTAALAAPDGLVLTSDAAARLFGEDDAMGQVVLVGDEREPHRVSGVVDVPGRTHLAAEAWLPLQTDEEPPTSWSNASYYTYVKLREGATQADLEAGLDGVLRHHAYPASGSTDSFEDWQRSSLAVQLFAQPLRDIYLHSAYSFELSPGGSPTQVYALGIVGLFLLLIAGANHVNLTTARAAARAKEVGVKKTMGAGQGALVRQFLAETVLFSVLAAVVAAGLAEAVLGAFAFVSGERFVGSLLTEPFQLLALLGFAVGVGVLAGMYPAFYLARFRPARVLRGGASSGRGNARLRGSLVVVQFAISIGLLVGSLVIHRQLTYMQEADKGMARGGVLFVENLRELGDGAEAFRRQLEQSPEVERTSRAMILPTSRGVGMGTFQTAGMEEPLTLRTFPGDEDMVSTLGLRLLAGRAFSADLASDSSAVLLSQSAVAALGLGDDPVGQLVNGGQEVIGVVADFHFQSMREAIEPVVLPYAAAGGMLAVQLRSGADVAAFLDRMQALWAQRVPEEPVAYSFLDDNFAALAAQERMLGRAVSFFTLLALVIAAMGLLGLVSFAVQQRTREIGVRKVLGAGVPSILVLLSKDFLRLVALAFAVAAPLAVVLMRRWLEGFVYHVDVGAGVVVLAGASALLVALLTVSTQALRAATADPIRALRSE